MKKIIGGFIGIVGTLALVSGVAYATLFGHVDTTASATTTNDLRVSSDGGSSFNTSVDLSSSPFNNLTTIGNSKVLIFENFTSKDTTALSVQQVGTLNGNTNVASDVLVAFGDGNVSTPSTSYQSIVAWETAGQTIPGVVVPAGSTHAVIPFRNYFSDLNSNVYQM